jgi:ATP-dependent Zn protease
MRCESASREQALALNQILTEMDGFSGREAILKVPTRKVPLSQDADLGEPTCR